jgi:hypothetical protein
MKNKKTIWVISGAFVLLLISVISFIIWGLPKNMGPIEPFLNFGDLFIRGDGETPGKPAYFQIGSDCSTGDLVTSSELIQPDLGCDSWETNRFERPFNAISQDEFYPDLDIQYAFFGRDADWYYLRMAVFDSQPKTEFLEGTYAMEMDIDVDGRGDLLVLVSEPGRDTGRKWSTQGVQIWADSNNDVGGEKPKIPEGFVIADGYDMLLFDQGEGDDPNGAWARVFMTGSAYIELAFKTEYLNGDIAFKWWVWSGYRRDPDMFDFHDFYSLERAGAANEGMANFPVKEVFALDSSCASMWGASPDLTDPDFCQFEVNIPDYDYNTCVMLKCIIPMLPCRIPGDKPGDDPCILNFREWYILVWVPDHEGEPTPHEKLLWFEYQEYLKNPYCPPEESETPTPTDTPTPTPTDTPTPTPTDTPTPTPTDTPTPRVPICNNDCGCEPDQGENEKNCPQDCPQHCGNDVCDCAETHKSCPRDCPAPCRCGDGKCDGGCGENRFTCPADC